MPAGQEPPSEVCEERAHAVSEERGADAFEVERAASALVRAETVSMYSAEARSSSVRGACSAVAFARASAFRLSNSAASIRSAMYSSKADSASSRARLPTAAVQTRRHF